jgi:hypothetical protein
MHQEVAMRVPRHRILTRSLAAVAVAAGVAVAALIPGGTAAGAPSSASAADVSAVTKTDATLRSLPTSASTSLWDMSPGTTVYIRCWTPGEPTYGTDKYGSMWLKASSRSGDTVGYVHSFLVTPVDVPPC